MQFCKDFKFTKLTTKPHMKQTRPTYMRSSPSKLWGKVHLYIVQVVQESYQEYVVIELPGPAPDGHCERSNDNLHQEEVQHEAGPQVPEQVDKRQDLDVVVPVVDRLAHLLGNIFLYTLTQYRHIVATLAIHCLMNDLWHFQLFGFPYTNNHISVFQTLYFFFTTMDTFILFSRRGMYHQEGWRVAFK